MTAQDYERLAAQMGIDRGAFQKGFEAEFPNVAIGKEPALAKYVGEREVPPLEDLSHMNPPNSIKSQRAMLGRVRPPRPAYELEDLSHLNPPPRGFKKGVFRKDSNGQNVRNE